MFAQLLAWFCHKQPKVLYFYVKNAKFPFKTAESVVYFKVVTDAELTLGGTKWSDDLAMNKFTYRMFIV
jgi:hypothetical protein